MASIPKTVPRSVVLAALKSIGIDDPNDLAYVEMDPYRITVTEHMRKTMTDVPPSERRIRTEILIGGQEPAEAEAERPPPRTVAEWFDKGTKAGAREALDKVRRKLNALGGALPIEVFKAVTAVEFELELGE